MKNTLLLCLMAFSLSCAACTKTTLQSVENEVPETDTTIAAAESATQEASLVTPTTDPTPEPATFYDGPYDHKSAFIVVSKNDFTLSVYAPVQGDTVLLARYPVCVGKNPGQKHKSGDMTTPESSLEHPFTISQIQDSHTWKHDFGDGRGSILSYGHWFLRLATPFNGIGIHGSTNNEASVPGRGSEGCIRLRDADIITLKERFAFVGMRVIIKNEKLGPFSFEQKFTSLPPQ